MKTFIVILLLLGLSGCNTKSKKMSCKLELVENIHMLVYGYDDNRIHELEYSVTLSFNAYSVNNDKEAQEEFSKLFVSSFEALYGASYITHIKNDEYVTVIVSMPINKNTIEILKQTDIVHIDEDNTVNFEKTIQGNESHGYVCSE